MQISVLKNLDEKLFGFRVDGDKFAVFSDLHLGSYFSREDYLKKAIKILKKKNISTVFIAGDILEGAPVDDFHSSKIVGCYNQIDYAEKFFKKLEEKVTFFVIPGNHDLFPECIVIEKVKKGFLVKEKKERFFDMVYELSSRLENMYFIAPEPTKRYALLVVESNGNEYRISLAHKPTKKDEKKIKLFRPGICIVGHTHKLKIENSKKRKVVYPGCFQERAEYHKYTPNIGFAILDFSYKDKVEIKKISL